MRVIIILATIAFCHGAKLENTYLPPSNARTAGGSGNFLQTPVSGFSRNQNTQTGPGQFGNTLAQSANGFAQAGNGIAQFGNNFAQAGNGFAKSGAEYDNVNYNFANQVRPERPRAALDRNAAILRLDSDNNGDAFSYAFETENGIYAEENGVATNGVEAQGGYSYTGDDGQVYSVRYTADQNGFVPQGDHLPTSPPIPEEILKALEQNARDEAAGIFDDGSYKEGKYADNSYYNGQINYQNQNSNTFNGNDEDSVVTNSAFSRVGPAFNGPRNGAFNDGSPANAGSSYSNGNNAQSYTSAATGTLNAGIARNSAAEKAYLPPFRGQTRNGFGRRPSFNDRTGYNY